MSASDEQTNLEDLERQLRDARQENAALRKKLQARSFNWRRLFSYIFLVLGLIIVIPASLLIWANRTITNTDQYVKTVGPVIHQPAVQQAIVKSATTSLYQTVDVQQQVTNLLPPQAEPLAGPIATQVENYINSTVAKVVASQQFANLWVNVNRRAQQRFMQIATSGNTSAVVDVNRLYQFISAQLADTPLAALADKQLPPQVGQIQIVTIPALANIPHFVSALSTLRWAFLGLAVGLLLAALAVSQNRRKTAVWIGAGWMIVTVISLIILRTMGGLLLSQIHDSTYKQAASDIWHALLTPFYTQSAVLFALGLVIALCGWLLGPAPRATRWRIATTNFLAARRTDWLPNADQSPAVTFLRRNHLATLWVLVIITIAVMLMLIPLSLASLTLVLVGALAVWLVLEFLVATNKPSLGMSR